MWYKGFVILGGAGLIMLILKEVGYEVNGPALGTVFGVAWFCGAVNHLQTLPQKQIEGED
jgi:hypothetical protein